MKGSTRMKMIRPYRRPAGALGAAALGALAIGAFALGGLAIGRLAVGGMAVRRARFDHLSIGTLEIERLRLRPRARQGQARGGA
ncbi:hypothetical protein ACUN0C_06885 [Faunimonas sp. B44]|uniref:hypothetical protein n=1 Tax=Faunimonas sp. B44 TaxID=3461493 RepID=UPI004044EDBA